MVLCGCFKNNIDEFEKKVKETYIEGHKHRTEYLEEIKKVKYLMGVT